MKLTISSKGLLRSLAALACVPALVSCGSGQGTDNLAPGQALGNTIDTRGSVAVRAGSTLPVKALANSRGPAISAHQWKISPRSGTAVPATAPIIQNADCSDASVRRKPIAGGAIVIAESECPAWVIVPAATPASTWTILSTATGSDASSSSASFELVVQSTPLPGFKVKASATPDPVLDKPVYLQATSQVESASPVEVKYLWSQIAGSPVTLGSPDAATAVFTPATAGDYVFLVKGTWDDGALSRIQSDIVQVHIADPAPPVAGDFAFRLAASTSLAVVPEATPVTLSATTSTRPGARVDEISYQWIRLFGPDVTTTSTSLSTLTLVPELPGKYVWAIEATLKSGAYSETRTAYVQFEVALQP